MNRVQLREHEDTVIDACRKGDAERVVAYIANGGCVTDTDKQKMTMLHHAAFAGNVEILNLILSVMSKQNIDLDAQDAGTWTPLHFAADRGHSAVVEILLNEGANANAKDDMKRTPLHLAAGAGHASVAQLLLAHGANRNAKSASGWDAKRYAEENHHDSVVAILGGQQQEAPS